MGQIFDYFLKHVSFPSRKLEFDGLAPLEVKINTSILYPSWKLGSSNTISHPPVGDFWAKKKYFQKGYKKEVYIFTTGGADPKAA